MMPFELYPDEHLYSGILRYFYRSGLMHVNHQRRCELLGFPSNLFKAMEPTDQGVSGVFDSLKLPVMDEFNIRLNHTVMPIRLLGCDYHELLEAMKSKEQKISKFEGRITSDVRWRYCPVCFREERKRLGIAYWHASHQLPSLMHCSTHNERLYSHDSLTTIKYQLPHHVFAISEPVQQRFSFELEWQPFIVQVYQKMKANPDWINGVLLEIKAMKQNVLEGIRGSNKLRNKIQQDIGLHFRKITAYEKCCGEDLFKMFNDPENVRGSMTSSTAILLGLFWMRHRLKGLDL